jgi:hypothetical protein
MTKAESELIEAALAFQMVRGGFGCATSAIMTTDRFNDAIKAVAQERLEGTPATPPTELSKVMAAVREAHDTLDTALDDGDVSNARGILWEVLNGV